MNIQSAKYNSYNGKNTSIQAVIDNQECSIPINTENRHYAAILEWAKEDGNTIQEAD
tara:strand:+ start:398 stop:568 length:171 start_codon:yes stop_codon:yes gene_type:complete